MSTGQITVAQAEGLVRFVERAFEVGKEGTNADHSATGLVAVALNDLGIAVGDSREYLADAWDEGFVAGSEWQPGHADGIPRDPQTNPYREQGETR